MNQFWRIGVLEREKYKLLNMDLIIIKFSKLFLLIYVDVRLQFSLSRKGKLKVLFKLFF